MKTHIVLALFSVLVSTAEATSMHAYHYSGSITQTDDSRFAIGDTFAFTIWIAPNRPNSWYLADGAAGRGSDPFFNWIATVDGESMEHYPNDTYSADFTSNTFTTNGEVYFQLSGWEAVASLTGSLKSGGLLDFTGFYRDTEPDKSTYFTATAMRTIDSGSTFALLLLALASLLLTNIERKHDRS